MPLPTLTVGESQLDLLDLKVSIVTRGIHVHDEVFEKFEKTCRLSRHPYSCNTMFLSDPLAVRLPVYMARTGAEAPFHLVVQKEKPTILYDGGFVAEVEFAPKPSFYTRKTSGGHFFGEMSILQGWDMISFAYLWRCDLATSGLPCRFCGSGNITLQAVESKQWVDFNYTPEEVAEIVQYAVEAEPQSKFLQLTAGSSLSPDAEIDRYVAILKAIDKAVGIEKIPPIIFLTPPKDVRLLDKLFDAGVGQVACDMDIWDETIFNEYCPGKAKYTPRKQHLDALLYIADKFGPNRACSVFVVGLEPLESFLEGATFLSERGIVLLPSPLSPYGKSKPPLPVPPGLEYYRDVRRNLANLYIKHNLVVPGTFGSSVCISRDVWLRRKELAD